MDYRAVFKCIDGCPGEYDLEQPIYRCPTCGDLLEVVHDVDALHRHTAAYWKKLFDDRYKRTEWPYGSAVWGKKEWVCPGVRDENIVSMDEGGTNLMWAERFGNQLGMDELWIKMCGQSHTGSFKDLGMTVLVSVVRQMIADGKSVRAVACASTGDTSASLAAYAAAANPLYLAFKNNWEFHPVTAKPTLASAIQIGNPVSVKKAIRTLQKYDGIVEQATESELADAAARADRTGMFNCPHTGVALAVLIKLRDRGQIGPHERAVVISTANGLKFTDFKVAYHAGTLAGVNSKLANKPVELPNDYDAVRRTVEQASKVEAVR